MSIDRTAALAELNYAGTTAARLQELAQAHPDLSAQILAHPNIYPGLADWIAQHASAVEAASSAASGDASGASAASAAAQAPKWVLPTVLGVGALATIGAIVAGIAFIPGLFPAEGTALSPGDISNAAAAPARNYVLGAEVTWTAPAVDAATLNPEAYSDFGISASDDVWVTVWPDPDDFHSQRLVALDPATGETLWTRTVPRLDCAQFALGGLVYCLDTSTESVVVFDSATGDSVSNLLSGTPASGITVAGEAVVLSQAAVVGTDYRISATAYDANGSEVWRHSAECTHWETPSANGAYASTWLQGDNFWFFGPCYLAWLDQATGTVIDSVTGTDAIWDGDMYVSVGAVLLLVDQDGLVAYNSDTSVSYWSLPISGALGYGRVFATTGSASAPLAVLDFESGEVTRVDAALAPTRVDSMPSVLPDCPEGWTPVGWSEWSGGATLICQAGDASVTVFVVREGVTAQSTSAAPTPTGFRATFDEFEFEVALDGWITWTDGYSQPASSGWTVARGASSYAPASTIETCPAGTFPLSLSTWRGGWLLTCGTSSYASSSFVYEVNGQRGSGGALSYERGRFCGTNDEGRMVCVSSSPALVQFGTGNDLEQHSVAENNFAGVGSGGAGRGQGAYGYDAPADTPQDQVGYLVAILESSATARSKVNSVLAPLNACSVSSGDVQALRELTQARTDLLNALATTPVDLVPNGATLLGHLTRALELSEAADIGYVNTGIQMAGGDCAGGRVTYRDAIAVANQAETAKVDFVNAWNARIPGEFGVRTFTARDI